MKVLVVHNRYRSQSASGENTVVDQETALLRSAGHEVVLYIAESDTIEVFPLHRRVALPARTVWSPSDYKSLRRQIRSLKPDVVHIHNTFPLISPSAVHAAHAEGVPVVMTLHNFRLTCVNGLLFRDGGPCELCVGRGPWSGVVHACYRGSRAASLTVAVGITAHRLLGTWTERVSSFIALTGFARTKLIEAGLPAARIAVKPNFVYPTDRPRTGAGKHVLYLGRLSPEKGVLLLLDAWTASSLPLVIAGDGPGRADLEAHATDLGGSVTFLGNQPRDVCSELLREARMLVVPSLWYEGFPVVVAEAYAQGVPVVAPGHGSFPEIVTDGQTGVLFRPGDAASLTQAMEQLSDPDASIAMGRRAKQRYEDRYGPERNLESLLRVYAEATELNSDGRQAAPSSG
jgi:glycosyltransferase involved in cell wall biosynthesis